MELIFGKNTFATECSICSRQLNYKQRYSKAIQNTQHKVFNICKDCVNNDSGEKLFFKQLIKNCINSKLKLKLDNLELLELEILFECAARPPLKPDANEVLSNYKKYINNYQEVVQ